MSLKSYHRSDDWEHLRICVLLCANRCNMATFLGRRCCSHRTANGVRKFNLADRMWLRLIKFNYGALYKRWIKRVLTITLKLCLRRVWHGERFLHGGDEYVAWLFWWDGATARMQRLMTLMSSDWLLYTTMKRARVWLHAYVGLPYRRLS